MRETEEIFLLEREGCPIALLFPSRGALANCALFIDDVDAVVVPSSSSRFICSIWR